MVQITEAHSGLPEDVAPVGQQLRLQQFQQGAFPRTVFARDADMLAGEECEVGLLVEGLVTHVTSQVLNGE